MDPLLLEPIRHCLKDKTAKVAIVSHTNPDGDAMGSSLALYAALKQAGFHSLNVLMPNEAPAFLHWLPYYADMIPANRKPKQAKKAILEAQTIFCLDFNGFGRTDSLESSLKESKALKIRVDHHPQPEEGFDFHYADEQVSSTAELVFEMLTGIWGESIIDQQVASCLYTGFATDTGSFSFSCNRPRTWEIMARLMSTGIDGAGLHQKIYATYEENRMRLLGYCLSEKLQLIPEEKVAYISLSREEMNRFNHQIGDTEGIVNYGMAIKNINTAALFTENSDHIKISFRSSGHRDVNRLARKFFNGGGHLNASGGKSYQSMDETLQIFEELVRSGELDQTD